MSGTLTAGLTAADVPADINTLQTDVAVLQTDTSLLRTNISDTVIINMANDNYTMTAAEACAATKAIVNGGTGKTLTIPTAALSIMPLDSRYYNLALSNVTLSLEAGGDSTTLFYGQRTAIDVLPGVGVYAENLDYANFSNSVSGGVVSYDSILNAFQKDDCGKLVRLNSTAGAQTYTIPTTADATWAPNSVLRVSVPLTADGATIQAEAGVTLNSDTAGVMAPGARAWIYKDNSSDTWYMEPT